MSVHSCSRGRRHSMNRVELAALVAVTALVACGRSAVQLPPGKPLVRGTVESIEHRATGLGYLVRAAPGSVEMCGIAATVTEATRFLRRTSDGEIREIERSAVEVGDTVEVFVDGPVAESCPVQGGASAILLVG